MEDPSLPPGILRTCTSCGSPIGTDQKFCEICGTKAEALPVCRKCGALFIAPVRFCELCGTPVIPEGSDQDVFDKTTVTETEQSRRDEPGISEPEAQLNAEPEPEETEPVQTPPAAKSPARPSDNALFLPDEAMTGGSEKPPVKKTFPNKALIAGAIVVVLIVIAAILFIGMPALQGSTFLAGAGPSPVNTPLPDQTTLPATMPTMTPAPVPTTQVDPLLPLPTEVMPKNQEVFFRVEKDQVTAKISVLFQNGPGVNVFKSADVKVTHPDGSVETETLVPSKSMEIFLDGSKGNDRIEVIANLYTGRSYRIKDEILPFKGH